MTKILGLVLIVAGLVGFAWGGFAFTTKEKIIDLGPIQATRDKQHSWPISPIAGALAIAGGVVLLTLPVNGKVAA